MSTPEELAERFVTPDDDRPGAIHGVVLSVHGGEPVCLGPFPNPALAKEKLEAVRRFVAAAIRAGCGEGAGEPPVGTAG